MELYKLWVGEAKYFYHVETFISCLWNGVSYGMREQITDDSWRRESGRNDAVK